MANLWVTRKEEVRQALHIAQEAKRLACAIKMMGSSEDEIYVAYAKKWEHDSEATIANFEFFIANAANLHPCYRFQTEIDVPQVHFDSIKKTMQIIFGIDVETLIEPLPLPEPETVVEQNTLF